MKKIILGTLIGFILTFPFYAFADDVKSTMIGKVVEGTFPVFVDGKKLSVDAIVIEGTSYVPVRAAGEAFGKEVDFTGKEIILSEYKEEKNDLVTGVSTIEDKIKALESEIGRVKIEMAGLKEALGRRPDDPRVETWQQLLEENEILLQQLEQQKEELEKQLAP